MDVDSLWEYADPALSESRFRRAMEPATPDEKLALLTQIARTYSLRSRFDEAHELLDRIEEQLSTADPPVRVRYLLERGRTFNSSGDQQKARPLFIKAWEECLSGGQEGLAVDAAHMIAITYAGTEDAVDWNMRALRVARASQDAKAQALIPALLNNSAWNLHDLGRFDEALPLFEEAEATWRARDKAKQIQIARWSVARCLRSLDRHDDALAIQRALETEHESAGTVDGYVLEEIAENLAALGKEEEARHYFGTAFDALSQDEWLVNNEPARIARLKSRSA